MCDEYEANPKQAERRAVAKQLEKMSREQKRKFADWMNDLMDEEEDDENKTPLDQDGEGA